MKNLFKYFIIILFSLAIYSCESPVPTEIISDDNDISQIEVEGISPNSDNITYSMGYDSTGSISFSDELGSIIRLGNSKVTYESSTSDLSIAQAMFFDRTKPVRSSGKIVAFHTKTLGDVYFNNIKASVAPLTIKLKKGKSQIDSLIGNIYVINSKDSKIFGSGSTVNFKLVMADNKEISYDIPVPNEMTAKVEIIKKEKKGKKEFEFQLDWNGKSNSEKIEVIIGGVIKGRKDVAPYLKLKLKDNGKTKVPYGLLKNFPFEKHDKLVFTFIRKKERKQGVSNLIGQSGIDAQSLHSVISDLPN